MRVLALILLAVTAGPAAAEAPPPEVVTSGAECTTEPAPERPILKVRRAPKRSLRVRVLGAGDLCDATWSYTYDGGGNVVLDAAADPDAISACGTCVITVQIAPMPAGRYTLELRGARVKLRVRS